MTGDTFLFLVAVVVILVLAWDARHDHHIWRDDD